ncbi:50S ribosomal protein L29 [Candidatus Uhrbacteria bacterium RIFCSPHIGHO2_02_FULL_47_44]|uniref:Large ribosomal subunit protein uL29 n=1 Tax=Candidatus Uhrbacteria bacterium RIFCSPLOWO2_02_FULL_48_18 TaxID=1802408 RepID=A0A1F7V899_9BACT|nr:MAG: 50S ribosomal protein L29 [Candidatus Uhrbacteria bacterium RIFCSPHIGHO2_01_FULL_47_10]OGL70952.1 MAG: 50S ribosomal protein L29 [Candidatus Uhrbacteria bacterium RIFCSPHIGHO2_02_FULL_47_44]OGL76944.1 MAG: 50S ribosomal protein L29 [Candidatus Uhrbacteria bacterium RIFCSPHIGHO2_12_FULL_47_12]OGL80723.1 MAG: 50S ribosomal protein L29 [Candidatus Uhrbacteria bacterium RIFCSPLOWO2_01_FULL_47_17]OGL86625.1 MAG: 50S ribosomal protein L29 [Candidatus Uhrbacteria bacterium RIFCSPLOWO2_02_FULL_
MDAKTLRQKTPDALLHDIHNAGEKLKSLEFRLSSNQVKNVREIRLIKKQMARMRTLVHESQKNT